MPECYISGLPFTGQYFGGLVKWEQYCYTRDFMYYQLSSLYTNNRPALHLIDTKTGLPVEPAALRTGSTVSYDGMFTIYL